MPEGLPTSCPRRTTFVLYWVLLPSILLWIGGCASNVVDDDKYKTLPKPTISSKIPLDVNHPLDNKPVENRPWLDTFSWQSFIALNWPVDPAWPQDSTLRGSPQLPDDPATFQSAPAGATTVWGSYKEAYELFSQGDFRPSSWYSNTSPRVLCVDSLSARVTKKMVMVGKGGTVMDSLNQAFSFPLIDQNLNYAWTEVRYNEPMYSYIRGLDSDSTSWLYLAPNLEVAINSSPYKAITMPAGLAPSKQGAIMLKATWRKMTSADDLSRYYTVSALLHDGVNNSCETHRMGLVGFHIVQKLADFPHWIWSSFEQVDNVKRGPGASPTTPISFNNGTSNPDTGDRGFANRPPAKAPPLLPLSKRLPVQVTRLNKIPDTPAGMSTQDLNRIYQDLLQGTVWRHYELVITQWPTLSKEFITPDDGGVYPLHSGEPFPASGATNSVMETYIQSAADAAGVGGNSCMSCHYSASASDFSWVLEKRSHINGIN